MADSDPKDRSDQLLKAMHSGTAPSARCCLPLDWKLIRAAAPPHSEPEH